MIKCWKDIREKTSGMSRKEAVFYIVTYYWYVMLAVVSVAALILLFVLHYGFGNKKPLFTCVIVNQEVDRARDLSLRDAFAKEAGIPEAQVVIDSGYQFSYGQFRMQGVNESSYEKFFFQWGNHEIDAVILSESFYQHCKEMGGRFYPVTREEAGGMELYQDEGQGMAVVLGTGQKDEKLLLAFPVSAEREEMRKQFLRFITDGKEYKYEDSAWS